MVDNPTVSFPVPIADTTLATYWVFPVVDTPAPAYDPMTENLTLEDPVYEDAVWVQSWAVTTATPAEQAERLASWRSSLTCSPLQGKIELNNQNLLDEAEAVVAAADKNTQLAWGNAIIWKRTSPMIETLGAGLGLSPTQLDDLFVAAQLIVV